MKLLGNWPLEDRKGNWRAKFRQICTFISIGKCKEYFFGNCEFTIVSIHSRQREMESCSFRRSIEEKNSLKNRKNQNLSTFASEGGEQMNYDN
ncbi:MAG: hypothetical protein RR139_12605, partial [Lachnospiraceae bacterium]